MTTVFQNEADRLEARLRDQREQLRRTPGDRILELDIEAGAERVRQLRLVHDAHVRVENQRAAAATKRDADARTELEQRLMADYRATGPAITEAEARAALPDLLHRHRLGEQDRLADAFAAQRRRVGSF